MEELKADLEEMQELLEKASRPKVKEILGMDIRKLQTEISKRMGESTETGAGEPTETQKPQKVTTVKNTRFLKILDTYAWDQSDKFMKIYVTLTGVKNIDAENITSGCTERSVKLNVSNLDGKDYQLHISNLYATITPDASYHKIKTDTVLLMLKKVEEKKTWAHVTQKDKEVKEKKTPKPEPDADPNAALMDMMKKMYDEGDDEMKKTIGKAWSENKNQGMQM